MASCQFTRDELTRLLHESGFGSNATMFDAYFVEGKPPLCNNCRRPIGDHQEGGGGDVVIQAEAVVLETSEAADMTAANPIIATCVSMSGGATGKAPVVPKASEAAHTADVNPIVSMSVPSSLETTTIERLPKGAKKRGDVIIVESNGSISIWHPITLIVGGAAAIVVMVTMLSSPGVR